MFAELEDAWPVYRLICEKHLDVGLVDRLSIDDVDLANSALDAWQAAEARAQKKADIK